MGDQAGGFDHLTTEITQLRQSTNELGDFRVELGRYQFLEDREKRKKRVRHLSMECHSQQKQGNNRSRFSLLLSAHTVLGARHSVTSAVNLGTKVFFSRYMFSLNLYHCLSRLSASSLR